MTTFTRCSVFIALILALAVQRAAATCQGTAYISDYKSCSSCHGTDRYFSHQLSPQTNVEAFFIQDGFKYDFTITNVTSANCGHVENDNDGNGPYIWASLKSTTTGVIICEKAYQNLQGDFDFVIPAGNNFCGEGSFGFCHTDQAHCQFGLGKPNGDGCSLTRDGYKQRGRATTASCPANWHDNDLVFADTSFQDSDCTTPLNFGPVCNDNNACTDDSCPDVTCVNTPHSCDDSNACTDDSCDSVLGCQYTPHNCDDSNACTDDSCDSVAGCQYAPHNCDDSNACTDDSCDSETGCVYAPHNCDDSNACTDDSCDSETGCVYAPHNCDDSNACTDDSCDSVAGCQYAPHNCDDSNACTDDSCDSVEGCQYAPHNCDDSNACTDDSCDSVLGCQYAPHNCDDGLACTDDSCDPATGCHNTDKNCDDSNACTTDSCDPATGNCVNSNAVVCTPLDQCHDAGVCDPATGQCSNPSLQDGTPCDADGTLCTPHDTCVDGVCVPDTPLDCSNPPNQCQLPGTCDPNTGACCYPDKPENSPCDLDDNKCTQDACNAFGVCEPGAAVVCTALDQCHDIGECDKCTGVCSNPEKLNGTPCNDNNACTPVDKCHDGQCQGLDPVTCPACDICHQDGQCNPDNGECSVGDAIEGCCLTDSDCANDPSGKTYCNRITHKCQRDPYCTLNSQCDDNDACTLDVCQHHCCKHITTSACVLGSLPTSPLRRLFA